jgi:hypothetical protein
MMKTRPQIHVFCAGLLAIALLNTPAQGLEQSWVSVAGVDANNCTRQQPCFSLQRAHDVTDAGGQINCVDDWSFPMLGANISKSITLDCGGTAVQSSGFVINGPNVIVALRNLTINGQNLAGSGIYFANGAALFVENCVITNLNLGAAGEGIGIKFAPQGGVTASLHVSDSIIRNTGLPSSGGGIIVQPAGTGSARVTIDRTRVENNTYGIFANGMGSTGLIAVQIKDSVVSNNRFNGVSAFTAAGQSVTSIVFDRSSSLLNGQAGILSQGANAFVILGSSSVMANGIGLSAISGGGIFSYQNNQLSGNANDGAAATPLTVK